MTSPEVRTAVEGTWIRARRAARAALIALMLVTAAACSATPSVPAPAVATAGPLAAPTAPPAAICDHPAPGPTSPPPGAVTVDSTVDGDLAQKTLSSPAGTTFWLAPGHHTLGTDQFGQVVPRDGDTYIGAPGAVLDGRSVNMYAFTQRAKDVTIRYLTVQGFVPPQDQGVVNHDSGNGWVVENDVIQNNKGAGLMAGASQQVRLNCIRDNGQYGMNAFQAGDGITRLIVENNEITGNNTDDWENKIPGCGCTGGIKFWAVNGADVMSNWVHDNHGPGLWADTDDNDFLVAGNLIEGNDGEALIYEISYNLTLRGNTLRNNTIVKGKQFAARKDTFPVGTIYLSESGGEPRVPARTDKIEIYDNVLENNWSGVTLWENADRFCNSPANTSTAYCTRLVPATAKSSCAQPGIAAKPTYDDCRWKTQRVDIHDNSFIFRAAAVDCTAGTAGRMAVLSNFGTEPDWSPYKGTVVQEAITFQQGNDWHDNTYSGAWAFMGVDTGHALDWTAWQAAPYGQDKGSTLIVNAPTNGC